MNLPAGDSTQGTGESLGDELARALDLGPRTNPVNEGARESAQEPVEGAEPLEEGQDPSLEALEAEKPAGEASEQGSEGETTPTEGEIRKFTDLTGLFDPADGEVTAEDLYGLEIISADGKTITVGDLKDMYQNRAAFETERSEFDRQRESQLKEIEEARQTAAAQTGQLQQMPEELREAEAAILAIRQRAQSMDWAKIEEDDPGEAALLRQKFRDAHDAATGRFQELQSKYHDEQQKAYSTFVTNQREKMFQRIPEWRDSKTLAKEREAIDQLVSKYGFTKQEMDTVVDPRLSQLLRDFMLLQSQFDEALKNRKQVKERGHKVLRAKFRQKPQARKQQLEQNAKRPGASRREQHEAIKGILSEVEGFL